EPVSGGGLDPGSGEQAVPRGVVGGLNAVSRAGLAEEVTEGAIDGVQANKEGIGDLTVALAGRDEAQDFDLAGRQPAGIGRSGTRSYFPALLLSQSQRVLQGGLHPHDAELVDRRVEVGKRFDPGSWPTVCQELRDLQADQRDL